MLNNSNATEKLSNKADKSAHVRLINNYFKITSEENSLAGNYKVQTAGLSRGLGNWLNVKNF